MANKVDESLLCNKCEHSAISHTGDGYGKVASISKCTVDYCTCPKFVNAPVALERELREAILAVDTTFDLGSKTTQAFLPPNFYIDRLVNAILAELTHTIEKAVVAELKKLLPEFEMVPMIAGWKPFPWATMKPEDQAEAKMWQSIHAHAAYYYQEFIKARIKELEGLQETK